MNKMQRMAKYFVNFLAQKGNEATSVPVHWHRSKLNNWETCFRGEIQSTNSLDFTLPLEAELCLFSRLAEPFCTKSGRDGGGQAGFSAD